jgi:two-component system, OmpR family, response regulator MprA
VVGRLLVVNDEPPTGDALRDALAQEGFDVILAADDAEALDVVHDTALDAVIVDVVEPDAAGAALCRRLRDASPRLPVLMLGAGDAAVERTGGLAVGADDYLAKPFVLVELLTRIRGLLRRTGRAGSEVLRFADLFLDPTTHEVVRDGRRIELTATEFTLLELFLTHPREVLPRAVIFRTVWGFDF